MRTLVLTFLFASISLNTRAEAPSITILAASSLTNVLPQIAKQWTQANIDFSFEASGKLAQQIVKGSPADLFFSADNEWMDFLQSKSLLLQSSRFPLLSNRLVMIVAKGNPLAIKNIQDLKNSSIQHLALAGEAVPAGKLARQVLTKNNLWDSIKNKVVDGENVRSALLWVSKKEAEAGIVFYTDSLIDQKVEVALTFPESDHAKIVYPAAVLTKSEKQKLALDFLKFCKSKKAQDIWTQAGFKVLF
ncbi:MAG: molybdate ABC transporter substrate-binding protein [Bacteriovoracaceae bacterium]